MKVDAASHYQDLCEMLRSLLPSGVVLLSRCSGSIAGDCVESLTLITNELVTNAAKYAFLGRDTGQIVVGYREEGAGWRLWVHDNGRGMPFDRGGITQESFGRQLITSLVARINAEIMYSSDQGTKVDVICGVTT